MDKQETLEAIARAVWREPEEDDDDFEHDRETLLGVLHDVRMHLHDAGVNYQTEEN